MLFSKRKKRSDASEQDLEALLDTTAAREHVYRQLNNDCLTWLRDFALNEEEIDTASFYSGLEDLRSRLRELDEQAKPPQPVDKHAAFIPDFIARQQQHLQERDSELRDVISILTRAVVEMNSRNAAYNSSLREQLESMMALSRLEDIRKLRSGLVAEIDQLNKTLEKKEEAETTSIQSLTGQVEVLRNELEQAQEESRRDGLTGIYNRRAFDWFVENLLDSGGSRKKKFALLMLDLDDFKRINDQHGHPVGDRVLLGLVEICRGVIRSEDFFARLGGDEFAIVFPGASARIAARKGRDICQTVNSRVFTVEETDEQPSLALSLSVSIGVTESKAGDQFVEPVKRADDALYAAKHEGKNDVRVG